MSVARFFAGVFLTFAMTMVGAVSGQDYPNKPIRIVTTNIGGSNDSVARVVAQGLSENLRQQVVVDNRPAGPLSGQVTARATPDGYTLMVGNTSTWVGPLLQKDAYTPLSDFSPIAVISSVPNLLVVHSSVQAKSARELIALAKAKPGELNYASGPNGGGSHLAVELFKSMAGVNIQRVAYKGGAAALPDLIGGRVQMTIDDVPTVASTGLPGYESVGMQGIFAPAKTPPALIRRLNQEVVRYLKTPEAKAKLSALGYDTLGSSPEEFAAILRIETERMGKLISDIGLRVD
jgi:tripartite-type tricarboxylate transporter receptor subunit TctC